MSTKVLNGLDLNNQRLINLADPTSNTDASTKQYVDNLIAGLSWKDEVRVATTTNGTLATAYANGQTIDGIALATGNRILVKNQTTQTENGIYVVPASGAPTRATDADATAELTNATVLVTSGTVGANTMWTQTTANPTVGSSNIVFAQFTTGTAYTGTAPISVSGTVVSINAIGAGLIGDGTSLRVDPAYSGLAKRFSANCVATTNPQTFTHNLGTLDVDTTVIEVSSGNTVMADVTNATTNTISVNFGGAPTAAQYRITSMA